MFSKDAHLKFFIDPLADTMERGTRIYCTAERIERNINIGKVVDVSGFLRYDGTGWRVTPDGYHLRGPVVNSENSTWQGWHLGWNDNIDAVVLGKFQGTHGRQAPLGNVRYSDQRKLPLPGGNHILLVDTWFKAAPWADELFPHPEDPDSVVDAKLELAEQRWTQRRAKVTLLQEGQNRGYDELAELIEDGSLPKPRFGAVFNGEVLIPAGRAPQRGERTVATQERVERVQGKFMEVVDPSSQYISMRASLALHDLQVEGAEALTQIANTTIMRSVHAATGEYDLKVADYSLQPVLRSADYTPADAA